MAIILLLYYLTLVALGLVQFVFMIVFIVYILELEYICMCVTGKLRGVA